MLDPKNKFALDGLSQVVIYGDNKDTARFYTVLAAPRIALDNQGKPLISLLIFGKRQGTLVEPMGGQFMMTSTLALTATELAKISSALTQRLMQEANSKQQSPPQATVLSPEWLDGSVEVHLTEHLQVSGKPSMMGANECTLNLNLGISDAKELQLAWNDGLPGASIIYHVQINAVKSRSTVVNTDDTEQAHHAGYASQALHSSTFQMDIAEAIRQPMTIEGPIPLSQSELAAQLQVIAM